MTETPFYTRFFSACKNFFAQRPRCTQKLLHRDPFTHEGFYTETLSNRSSCTETLLDTVAFTQKPFYTQRPLHRVAFTQRAVFTLPILREKVARDKHFTAASGDAHAFRAGGSPTQVFTTSVLKMNTHDLRRPSAELQPQRAFYRSFL